MLVEEVEGALLGLVALARQVLERLATGGLLPSADDATVLVLYEVLLLEATGGVLRSIVPYLGLGSNGEHVGHLILLTAIKIGQGPG